MKLSLIAQTDNVMEEIKSLKKKLPVDRSNPLLSLYDLSLTLLVYCTLVVERSILNSLIQQSIQSSSCITNTNLPTWLFTENTSDFYMPARRCSWRLSTTVTISWVAEGLFNPSLEDVWLVTTQSTAISSNDWATLHRKAHPKQDQYLSRLRLILLVHSK